MEFIVEKVGMSRTVTVPSNAVTLLKVKEMKVCQVLENGQAIVAYNNSKAINKAIEGQQKKYSLSKEFNKFATLKVANTEVGNLDMTPLIEAKKVKTTFNSKGRGFTGVIKRHGFAQGPKTHGSRFHRRVGSIGMCEWPGRVMKGKKMPGQYGNKTATVQNEILEYDADNRILVVKGSVGGFNGALGKIRIAR